MGAGGGLEADAGTQGGGDVHCGAVGPAQAPLDGSIGLKGVGGAACCCSHCCLGCCGTGEGVCGSCGSGCRCCCCWCWWWCCCLGLPMRVLGGCAAGFLAPSWNEHGLGSNGGCSSPRYVDSAAWAARCLAVPESRLCSPAGRCATLGILRKAWSTQGYMTGCTGEVAFYIGIDHEHIHLAMLTNRHLPCCQHS